MNAMAGQNSAINAKDFAMKSSTCTLNEYTNTVNCF